MVVRQVLRAMNLLAPPRLSAIGQTRPATIEIKDLKTSHFKESETAPWNRGEIGSMGHGECTQSESANNDLQPGRSRMVAATDCERAGDQSRDSGPVFGVGKTESAKKSGVKPPSALAPAFVVARSEEHTSE